MKKGQRLLICSWNVHHMSFLTTVNHGGADTGAAVRSAAFRQFGVDVLCLQEVSQDKLDQVFGHDYHAIYSPAPGLWLGNALVVPQSPNTSAQENLWKVVRQSSLKIDVDRAVLSVMLEASEDPACRIRIYCTHLDYQSETRRLRQMQKILDLVALEDEEQGPEYAALPVVLVGDLNALTREDYDESQWVALVAHRMERRWEPPESLVVSFLKEKGWQDLTCSNHRIFGSRFQTRIDYFFGRASAGMEVLADGPATFGEAENALSDHQPICLSLMVFPSGN